MARTLLKGKRFSGQSFREKKETSAAAGYYGSIMLCSRATSHRLCWGKQTSSNSPIYVQPQTLSCCYPWTLHCRLCHSTYLPIDRWVLGCTDGWVCGTQTTNNWLNWVFFLLENTRGSQYGSPKIKSLSVNPMGYAVARILQDLLSSRKVNSSALLQVGWDSEFVVRAWHKHKGSPSTRHGLTSQKTGRLLLF